MNSSSKYSEALITREPFLYGMIGELGLDRVVRAGYQLLGLQTYFTAGVKEVRAGPSR